MHNSTILLACLCLLLAMTGCGIIRPAEGPAVQPETPPDSVEVPEPEAVIVCPGIEQQPLILGGRAALYDRLSYPDDAREAGIEGHVVVGFVVDEQGQAQDVEIVQGLCPTCDAEAIRVIEALAFVPGQVFDCVEQQMVVQAMRFSLPVAFGPS